MAVPCVSDTDCIVASLDGQNRLQLSLVVDPDGGLECVGGTGLRARIQGDPAAVAPSDCQNLLRLDTNGDLLAQMPGMNRAPLISIPTPVNVDNIATTLLASGSLKNDTNCDQLMIAHGEFHIGIAFNASNTPYWWEGNAFLTCSGAGVTAANTSTGLTANDIHEKHGYLGPDGSIQFEVTNHHIILPVLVPPGSTAAFSLRYAAMPGSGTSHSTNTPLADTSANGNGHVSAFRYIP